LLGPYGFAEAPTGANHSRIIAAPEAWVEGEIAPALKGPIVGRLPKNDALTALCKL
jgi:hypothetical protein